MRRGLLVGFAMWFVTTMILRIWGGWLLEGDMADFMLVMLVAGILAGAVTALLLRYVCTPGKVARFGAGLAIPGLFGYAGSLIASLTLWWYAIVLSTALLYGDRLARN